MASKIRSRQERVNVHVARVLSELGLSTRAETWFLDGHRAPDFIIMHPLVQEILGEAEVGDIDSVCDEAIIDKPKIREKVAERFADPRLAGYNFILLLTYRRKDLEELAELDDSKVAERVKTLKVCVGLATRAEAYELREHYIHVYREPVEITSIPSVLNILINEFFQKTFKKTLSIKEAEQFVDRLISLIDHASSGLAREIMESKEKEKLLEDLKGVASKLSIAWDSIKDPLERIKLTYKTILLVEALGMMLYKIVSKKLFLKPLDCQRLSHEVLIEYLEGLLDRGKYNELNSSFLELLKSIPSHELLDDGLQKICREIVQETPSMKPISSIILSMLYQRMLSETFRHAFATFYTKMPAAKILAGLAVESFWDRVIDPACGTGSLLLASLERRMLMLSGKVLEKIAKEADRSPVLEIARSKVLENTVGLDALKPAVLISALNLRIATYGSPPHTLNLYHVPVGEDRAGSLDILTGMLREEGLSELLKGGFDLVIMNPPFTRSDRISALIGKRARETLAEYAKDGRLTFGYVKVKDIFKAGMAKPFMVLADKLVKDGGRIAAVLPTSILSRPGWNDIREGLVKNYSIEYIVISWAPGAPNFSSDTNLREILLVARKSKEKTNLKVIGLLKRVDDLDHADVETIVRRAREVSRGYSVIMPNNGEVGYVMVVDRNLVEKFSDNLYRLVAFKNPKLLEFHHSLISSGVKLGDLFYIGSVIDHTSGLRVVNRTTSTSLQHPHPAVWGSGDELFIKAPLADRAPYIVGVEREDLVKVKYWSPTQDTFYSAKLFILRRGQLDTQYVLALSLNEDAVSNVWWPLRLKDQLDRDLVSRFLVFMNSTFGFFHLLGERLETRGLYVEYKKQHLVNMLLPDLRKAPPPSQDALQALKSPMPRFDDYLELAARLNQDRPLTDVAGELVKKNNEFSARARLDLEVAWWLTEVFKLDVPQEFYKALHEEIKTLRSIMERSREEEEVIEDEPRKLIATKHRTLDKWFIKSK
jgi:type I restriction-modification system DNA methylase subunit